MYFERGEVIMPACMYKVCHKSVTSDKTMFHDYMAQFFYFGIDINNLFYFLIKTIPKKYIFENVINRL